MKEYIVQKFVRANSVMAALRKEKDVEVSEIFEQRGEYQQPVSAVGYSVDDDEN